jgi:hypothetical protein
MGLGANSLLSLVVERTVEAADGEVDFHSLMQWSSPASPCGPSSTAVCLALFVTGDVYRMAFPNASNIRTHGSRSAPKTVTEPVQFQNSRIRARLLVDGRGERRYFGGYWDMKRLVDRFGSAGRIQT